LIAETAAGRISLGEAFARASLLGKSADIGCARLDYDRVNRCGMPEFIYGAGKSVEELLKIASHMVKTCGRAMATRLDEVRGRAMQSAFPDGEWDSAAGTFLIGTPAGPERGTVAVLCAGTSDMPVAREAVNTLRFCGIHGEIYCDAGVANIGRVLALESVLRRADAVIVAAGMEGALPSVVGGLIPCPVIAVPTSVGYGAAMNGFAALTGMLNSCAAGVTVVNIDNGFGAACAAVRMLRQSLPLGRGNFLSLLVERGIRIPEGMCFQLEKALHDSGDGAYKKSPVEFFREKFADLSAPCRMSEYCRVASASGEQSGVSFCWHMDGSVYDLCGQGNGPLSAVCNALNGSRLVPEFQLADFSAQMFGDGAGAPVLAFAAVRSGISEQVFYGAGIHTNFDYAAVSALVSALNLRDLAKNESVEG